jgi:addiction module HigA family antidote
MSLQRLNEIVNGKRGVTADSAWLFGQAFGTSPEFWTNAQSLHDLTKARPEKKLSQIKPKKAA